MSSIPSSASPTAIDALFIENAENSCLPNLHHIDSCRDIIIPPLTSPPDLHIEKTLASLGSYLGTVPVPCDPPTRFPGDVVSGAYLSSLSDNQNASTGDGVHSSTGTSIDPERRRIRLFSAFFLFFVCGWGDGVTGTILPHIQSDLHLSYMTSSLLFIANTVGFAVGTALLETVMTFLGRIYISSEGKSDLPTPWLHMPVLRTRTRPFLPHVYVGHSASQARSLALAIASISHACFFILMGSRRGFASVLAAYFVASFSRAFLTGTINAYVASTPRKPLGFLHGSWGFGAFAAPLVCQSILDKGVPWGHFYFGSLVLSAINTTLLVYSFRPIKSEYIEERRASLSTLKSRTETPTTERSFEMSSDLPSPNRNDKYDTSVCADIDIPEPPRILRLALTTPYVYAFSLFAWIYSGSETTTTGYMVTYLLTTRHANPNTAGYATSGFWAGMTISRVTSGILSPRLTFTQRKHLIHVFLVVALVMHLLIWFVNSNVENAFSTGIVGLMYGPIFPGTLALATEVLPKEVHLYMMAIISAFASLGGSIFPFVTGVLANSKGPHILTYVLVAQVSALITLWFFFPSHRPTRYNPS